LLRVLIVFSLCVFLVMMWQDGSCDGSGDESTAARSYRGSEKLGVVDYDVESAPSPAPSEQGLQRFD